ncbi:hypothetical protein PSECIP111951_01537 [Pseudoalteromonas holothuriae]|uniref:Uncharacterized protein n=1 Tax=Pseudoalteromonas holothuriae TaxID=2963714 RepID=A0A9W4QSM8_9GAMM|nr:MULTISPECIES: hypothetical protein [unclassified Pseudoalteromonas]CAH9051332.1 hypothetical protein PSECIP111854_00724 [Pseudoalteromonas sp. CIP111854]CAH9056823.1 hypothetical protein PSECIP111951_01537 [Pseudoalteromonas sp. CIP111951]
MQTTILKIFLLFVAVSLSLVGCDQVSEQISYQIAEQKVRSINLALIPSEREEGLAFLPFTDTYLEKRHEIYNRLSADSLNENQQSELNYLKIQERYPERYLPWPAHVNVLHNALMQQASEQQIKQWMTQVIARLDKAKQSKIYLSRIELSLLKSYLTDVSMGETLQAYLEKYKPRSGIGLYQIPNGKEWYQSKLNFYYTQAVAPNMLLNEVQEQLAKSRNKASSDIKLDIVEPFALSVLKQYCDNLIPGLNWIDKYVNLPGTYADCKPKLTNETKKVLLALMEIDLGINYQGWSYKQASLTLGSRLHIADKQVSALIENTVLYPGSILTFLAAI